MSSCSAFKTGWSCRSPWSPGRPARTAAEAIAQSRFSLIKTKVEKELGLRYGESAPALGDAAVVGGMYALAAVIPLWPYFIGASPPHLSSR